MAVLSHLPAWGSSLVMIRSLIRLLSRMELPQKALLRQRMPPRPVTLQRAPAEPVRPKGLTRQGPRETRPESRHLREMSLSQALRLRPELQELRQLMQPEPGSAGGSPVEQPAGKHFPWKTVILILVTLLVIAALAVGGWFLWKKFGSMLTGLFPQPVPAKVEDPCSVESATSAMKASGRSLLTERPITSAASQRRSICPRSTVTEPGRSSTRRSSILRLAAAAASRQTRRMPCTGTGRLRISALSSMTPRQSMSRSLRLRAAENSRLRGRGSEFCPLCAI